MLGRKLWPLGRDRLSQSGGHGCSIKNQKKKRERHTVSCWQQAVGKIRGRGHCMRKGDTTAMAFSIKRKKLKKKVKKKIVGEFWGAGSRSDLG